MAGAVMPDAVGIVSGKLGSKTRVPVEVFTAHYSAAQIMAKKQLGLVHLVACDQGTASRVAILLGRQPIVVPPPGRLLVGETGRPRMGRPRSEGRRGQLMADQ